jgi:hypothetical protein
MRPYGEETHGWASFGDKAQKLDQSLLEGPGEFLLNLDVLRADYVEFVRALTNSGAVRGCAPSGDGHRLPQLPSRVQSPEGRGLPPRQWHGEQGRGRPSHRPLAFHRVHARIRPAAARPRRRQCRRERRRGEAGPPGHSDRPGPLGGRGRRSRLRPRLGRGSHLRPFRAWCWARPGTPGTSITTPRAPSTSPPRRSSAFSPMPTSTRSGSSAPAWPSRGPICRCGNRGCLETVASSQALVSLVRPSRDADLGVREVVELAKAGDSGCRRAIADAGRMVGGVIAGL